MGAVRVAGEAVALLRDQGRDSTTLLDLLLAEIDVRPDPAAGQVEVVVADRGAAAQAPGGCGRRPRGCGDRPANPLSTRARVTPTPGERAAAPTAGW